MSKTDSPTNLRQDYRKATLDFANLATEPFVQFENWFTEACAEAKIVEPNAMCLATSDETGRPAARIVLLKGIDSGFLFFTNFESRKGQNLDINPQAALNFWWPPLERQIRIEGRVEKIAHAESEKYFQSRPRASQIGAWASPQSQKVADRAVLEQKQADLEGTFSDEKALPLPPFWGGFRLIPDYFEFWQGRSSRLHDRFAFEKQGDGAWKIDRLAP